MIDLSEYFDDIPVGQLTQGYYERVRVYECKVCSALVRDGKQAQHVEYHGVVLNAIKSIANAVKKLALG